MEKSEAPTTGACINPACDQFEVEVPIEGDGKGRCLMCRGPLEPTEES